MNKYKIAQKNAVKKRRREAASPYRLIEEVSRKMRGTASGTLGLPFEQTSSSPITLNI
jgi:hypothetical protein